MFSTSKMINTIPIYAAVLIQKFLFYVDSFCALTQSVPSTDHP